MNNNLDEMLTQSSVKKSKKKRKEFGIEYWITLGISALLVFNIPTFLYFGGKFYLEQNNYGQAYKFLRAAHLFKPKNKDIRYHYVKSMTALKPTLEIQTSIYKFSESPIKDVAKDLANYQVEEWKKIVLNKFGENYIEQVPFDRNVIRWDVTTFPLKIAIEAPEYAPDYYYNEIEKAFAEWENRTNFLEFEFADESEPQITVKFEPLPDDICNETSCKYVVAYTNPDIKGKILKSMTITLYDRDANGNYFSDKEIYNTVLHEIGHALGIMGHSYSSDDLMYMSTMPEFNFTRYRSNFHFLSKEDLNTINLLYKLVPNISNTPISKMDKTGLVYSPIILGNEYQIGMRKVVEAQNYIKSAPDLPGGYIDLGVAYADIGKNTEAVSAFKLAKERATTDNDRYIIYFNLAIVHMNMNKLDDAETFIKLAAEIDNNQDIAELLTNINHAKASNSKPFKTNIFK